MVTPEDVGVRAEGGELVDLGVQIQGLHPGSWSLIRIRLGVQVEGAGGEGRIRLREVVVAVAVHDDALLLDLKLGRSGARRGVGREGRTAEEARLRGRGRGSGGGVATSRRKEGGVVGRKRRATKGARRRERRRGGGVASADGAA